MGKIITFINQKGGVGKTTNTLNVGAGLHSLGFSVLFVDADAQCNLTYALGGNRGAASTRELLTKEADIFEAIQHVKEGDLVPGSFNLSTMDLEMNYEDKTTRLKEALEPVKDVYDYILIDTPPTLGIVTINVLGAVDDVIIPVNVDIFSLQGIAQLYRTITAVRKNTNPKLNLAGILVTIDSYDSLLEEKISNVFTKISEMINTKIFETKIIESDNIRESVSLGKSIFRYAPKSIQARNYLDLIKEIRKI